jgi:hypothetical protein
MSPCAQESLSQWEDRGLNDVGSTVPAHRSFQPTLLFDEMENLGQTQHTELHRMLKYGFERNGPEVWRMESSQNRMEMSSWSVYCPRAFASIEGMEDVIASRSVQIIMERSFNEEIKNRTVNADDTVWQLLRDQLFLVTLRLGKRLGALKVYDETKRTTMNGRKVTLYRINPEVITKKLENHLRG